MMCKYHLKYIVVRKINFVYTRRKKSVRGIERKRRCGLTDKVKDEGKEEKM